jgi:PilZ domain
LFRLDLLGAPRSKSGAGLFPDHALVLRRNRPLEQETMEERRKYPRTEINEPAYVSSGGSVMTCVVRNISPEGAAIDVENPAFVPARFRLVMAKDSSVQECAVAWIQKNRIGLMFVAAPKPERG